MLPRGAKSQTRALSIANDSSADPRCFLPSTVFKQVNGDGLDGEFITASDLRSDGGEILLGPGGSQVRVIRTKRHGAEQRCFLKIHTSQSMLEVTHDHRVVAEGPGGSQTIMALSMTPHILTGAGPQPVQRFELHHRSSEVMEPIFEDDAAVLVWTRSGRRSTRTELQQAFAVKGGLCDDPSSLFEVSNGFFDGARTLQMESVGRSRSADSRLTPVDRRRLARARSSIMSKPLPMSAQDMSD